MTDSSLPGQSRRETWTVFVLLVFVFAYFYQESAWNGNSRFGLIFAIVQEGRLTIDSFHDRAGTRTRDKAYYNGHYYSEKTIGPAALGTAFYAPWYWLNQGRPKQSGSKALLTFLAIGLPAALAGSLMYRLCLALTGSRRHAYLATMAVALGTLYFPFGVAFFSHTFTAAWLFCAFYLAIRLKRQPESWQAGSYVLFGALLGWALVGEYPAAIVVIILLVYYFFTLWRNPLTRWGRAILLPLIGGGFPIALQLLYNRLCFDSWFSIGYNHLSLAYFQEGLSRGFMGFQWPNLSVLYYMTLHPTVGLFWQSPVLLLTLLGAAVALRQRRYRAEALVALASILSLLLLLSGYFCWWGGNSLGPRYIIPMLPFFCVLLAFVPRRSTWLLALLCLLSFGQMLIGAASSVLTPGEMVSKIQSLGYFEYSHIYSHSLKLLQSGRFASNLGMRLLGLHGWLSLAPLLAAIALVSGWFYFSCAIEETEPLSG